MGRVSHNIALQSPKPKSDLIDVVRSELARARAAARAWAETISDTKRISQAALFSEAAMISFAKHAAPDLTFDSIIPRGKLDLTARRLAEAIGTQAGHLDTIEATYFLTGLYTALLPGRHRSALGAFYTPPSLSRRLLDLAEEAGLDWTSARVLDPACGGGAFLIEAATRIRNALSGSEPAFVLSHIGRRLCGFEIDPHAASLAQMSLEITLADLIAASGKPLGRVVTVCDTLAATPTAEFDLVVGNPPYGRVTLDAEQRQKFRRSLYGHANLYGVFTDIALRWARPGGLIAYLTPTSVLGGQYYAALRSLLGSEAPPISVDFVHARRGVFEDVLQETMLALYQQGRESDRIQVHYLHVVNEREARPQKNGKVRLPKDRSEPWMAPRQPEHAKLIAATESMPTRLSDWGYGVSTGPLVWNRYKRQLRDRASAGSYPLIWAESVTADGRFIYRAQKRNHAPYFHVERGDDWLVTNSPCVLLQRTTAKEQARRLIAAELPAAFIKEHGAVVIENHLNMLVTRGKPKVTPAALAAILNSDIVDQVFRCISGSVAVSAFELKSLPLPSVADMRNVERLITQKAERETIEAAIRALYEKK